MSISKDKLMHVALGVLAMFCAALSVVVLKLYGFGALMAYTTTAVGVLYEIQQWWRGEGQPDPVDALCTTAPGFVFWGVWSLL